MRSISLEVTERIFTIIYNNKCTRCSNPEVYLSHENLLIIQQKNRLRDIGLTLY